MGVGAAQSWEVGTELGGGHRDGKRDNFPRKLASLSRGQEKGDLVEGAQNNDNKENEGVFSFSFVFNPHSRACLGKGE